jgi:fatty-acyl-CoA synthase
VPFYHCFGMVMGNLGCTTHGATMVIPPTRSTRARARAVEAERCTALYGVPTMFIAELGHPSFDRFDLTRCAPGDGRVAVPGRGDEACVDRMHMAEVTICYGMTETSPVSTQTLPDDSLHHRTATVGRAHPHVEIAVADPRPGDVPRGRDRRVLHARLLGDARLLERPERTAEAIDADGWMHTGDLAVMDDDGYVNIVGRIKDMVIRGGENVYPREIEEFLYTHPDVEDVQVIGVPDERYGEELMAWVSCARRRRSTRGAAGVLPGRIAHYKVPRYVQVRRRVPDDRHRQGPEVQDARAIDRRAVGSARMAGRSMAVESDF